MQMSALVKAELAATCSTLGRPHAGAGRYVVDPQCYESVRDLIRYLRRDDAFHEVRLYLGDAKILQNDLVPIAKVSPPSGEMFDIVIRLLVNLTNPIILLYKEEIPAEKVGRNIYMHLISQSQDYKSAFCDVEFWKAVCARLTELFEVDWSERSEEYSVQIERLLVLLRNVLQVPADSELERRPDNDITVHDKVLWALRESQLLEILLYVSSNRDEEKYFLHILEIFSLILREQSPTALASCEIRRSAVEKERDVKELASLREKEKSNSKSFKNTRSFSQTFVLKNVKSISENEVVYHKSLDKLNDLKLTQDKKRVKTPKNKFPEDSERAERRSTFSVRLFLKEFCIEFLTCSFNSLIGVVKDKLVAGKGLSNDESYYFWALKFFLEFSCAANVDIKLFSECLNVQTFHYVQTQLENCYDHLQTEKKKLNIWVRRLHLTLKAYRSLLQTLLWMDNSKDPKIREISKVIKANIFYVVEYRELMIHCLNKYDPGKFPLSFLRDLIETNHINLKLLEAFCKTSKIVVQKKKRVIKKSKKKVEKPKEIASVETPQQKWEQMQADVFGVIDQNKDIPDIAPFDAASSVPIDDQKEDAMKNIQKYLRNSQIKQAVGLFRSARQVWPENDFFGNNLMSIEEEVMALQEICLADVGVEDEEVEEVEEDEEEEEEEERRMDVVEQGFDVKDYIKKLVNKKVIEGCCILLNNYKKNTANTNHAVLKLMHRIGWDCKCPSMFFQASFFITLNKILHERDPEFREAQQFAKHLFKKFRENAASNPKIYMELLFWKDAKIAIDIESGYGTSDEPKETKGKWSEEEEDELKRLWVEFDEKMLDGDKVDWIRDNLINQSRSRIGIIKKLKDLMLIAPGAKVAKKKRGGSVWSEEECSQLAALFDAHKSAVDVVGMIRERISCMRSKKSIKDKLLEMGLVNNLAELRKKRAKKAKSVGDDLPERADSSLPSSSEDEETSDVEPEKEVDYSAQTVVCALRLMQSEKGALEWLKESFEECLEDDEGVEGFPLLALDSNHAEALDNPHFQSLLRTLLFNQPTDEQIYWKFPKTSKIAIHERLELIKAAIDNTLQDIPGSPKANKQSNYSDDEDDYFDKLRRDKTQTEIASSERMAAESAKSNRIRTSTNSKIASDDSDGEDDYFDKLRIDKSSNLQNKEADALITESAKPAGSSDESDMEARKSVSQAVAHTLDSDRSGVDDGSGEEMVVSKRKKSRRALIVGSDSEEENSPVKDQWRYKRRRCIGSDSEIEMEGNPSDGEDVIKPREVLKKSRMLGSDSENESVGSPVDNIRMSR